MLTATYTNGVRGKNSALMDLSDHGKIDLGLFFAAAASYIFLFVRMQNFFHSI